MRIGIDATAVPDRFGGVGHYVVNLANHLARLGGDDEILVFCGAPFASHLALDPPRLDRVPVSLPSRLRRLAWEQLFLPGRAGALGLDVLHSPHYTMPLGRRAWRSVVTFHDMIHFLHPEKVGRIKEIVFQAYMRRSARKADALVCDSEATRDDAVRILDIPPQRIRVAPLGIEAKYRRDPGPEAVARVRETLGLPNPYCLYVGALAPHKNLPALVRAFRTVAAARPALDLVLAGGGGADEGAVRALVKALGLSGRVRMTGYVDGADLPALYRGAALFVFPSLYEGFGFPPLEAMACGVPVVSSGAGSLAEVLGDAALRVDARDPGALAAGIARVLDDPSLRAALARKGPEQAARFTWERTARETRAAYEAAVAAGPREGGAP